MKIPETYIMENQAEYTNRLIDSDPNFQYPEWQESGTINGVPVNIFYRTTPEDAEIANESDWGNIDWESRVDRIEINVDECDIRDISDEDIKSVMNILKTV